MRVTINQNIIAYRISIIEPKEAVRVFVTENTQSPIKVTIAQLGARGFKGEPGVNYIDVELIVTEDDQTQFSIFYEPEKSNLFVNDAIYFKDKSYLIQNILGNWSLIWLNQFPLKTNDLLIFRRT